MKTIRSLSVCAFALVAGTSAASEFYTYPSGSNLTAVASGFAATSVHNGAAPAPQVQDYNGHAGQFTGNYYTGSTAPADSLLKFFCVEFEYSQPGPLAYGMSTSDLVWGSTASTSQAVYNNLRKLYDLYYPNKTAGDFWSGAAPTNFGTFGSAASAAAFQLAVWEIVFDNTNLNLSDTGSLFYANSSDTNRAEAQNYLNAVSSYVGSGYENWTLYKFFNPVVAGTPGAQDYVTATYRVPEPGSLALVGLALAGLGFVSRRRG